MYSLQNQLDESTYWLRNRLPFRPEIAVVLGSGLSGITNSLDTVAEIPYADIPYYPRVTVKGHKGILVFAKVNGVSAVFACGRHHLYEGYSLDEITFGTRIFAQLGIDKIILSNSAGSVNPEYPPGEFIIITDLFALSPLLLAEDDRTSLVSKLWAPDGTARLGLQAKDEGIHLHTGTYAWTIGPSYETPAEVRYLRQLGADAVGMSTLPEAIIAAQLGMEVVGISCLTNYATGLTQVSHTHQEVRRMAKNMESKLSILLTQTIELFSKQ